MNSSNHRANMEGHRIGSASNRDLTQKLTYQQLLNLNHDLSKENLQLKNIGTVVSIQAIVSATSCGPFTISFKSSQETKTLNSIRPSMSIQSFINTNSHSSLFWMLMKPKYKSFKTDLKPSMTSSSLWRKNTRK